jgi:multidrug efflux pump subunit AcrB
VWIVQIALRRPYTFVVFALLIAIFGVLAARRTPVDIFPNINVPVVSVVWTYNGLPPNDMSGRVIYFYERYLTAQVGDIQHIESQSLSGYGVVKIFFQKDVNIAAALAQVTAASQTVLKLLPPGITPPYVLSYNASSVPILQLALSSKKLPQMQLFDLGQNFIRPRSRPSPAPPCLRPTAARFCRCRSTSTSRRCRPTTSPPTTCSTPFPRRT